MPPRLYGSVPRRGPGIALEVLEDRLLLTGTPLPEFATAPAELLDFINSEVQANGSLADGSDYDLYQVSLKAGDVVSISLDTTDPASALDGYLRVFGAELEELFINDNASGPDPSITFQAAAEGDYYIGVSSAGNTAYEPRTGQDVTRGKTQGLYQMEVIVSDQPLPSDLVVAAFDVAKIAAGWGESVTVGYRLENRGAEPVTSQDLHLWFSAEGKTTELGTIRVGFLDPGHSVSAELEVELPGTGTTPPAGLPEFLEATLGVSGSGAGVGPLPSRSDALFIGSAEMEQEPNGTLETATLLDAEALVEGSLSPGDVDIFRWNVADGDRLEILVSENTSPLLLRMKDGAGRLLFEQAVEAGGNLEALRQAFEAAPAGKAVFLEVVSLSDSATTFRLASRFLNSSTRVGTDPRQLQLADVNADGRLDLITANGGSNDVSVLLGNAAEGFDPPPDSATGRRAVPLVADVNADTFADALLIDNRGRVLVRFGQAQQSQSPSFQPPVILNAQSTNAQDLTVVNSAAGLLVGVLERDGQISLYRIAADQSVQPLDPISLPGSGFVRIASADLDLDADQLDDLVVTSSGTSEVLVLYQLPDGSFEHPLPIPVGNTPTALTIADVDGNFGPDLIVSNSTSGDVSMLLNDPSLPFMKENRYRADLGQYATEARVTSEQTAVTSYAGTFGAVPLESTDGSLTDLLTLNTSTNRITRLSSVGRIGYLAPQQVGPFHDLQQPTQLRSGNFNSDGRFDFAVLDEALDQLFVFTATPEGEFQEQQNLQVDPTANGLTVHDVNDDGELDLLVGNEFGDLLIFLGNGDGTFREFQRADQTVTLATTDLNNDGWQDAVVANERADVVRVQYRIPDTDQFSATYADPDTGELVAGLSQTRTDGLQAPGGTAFVDINNDGWTDLLLLNSGSNQLRTYLSQADGTFSSPTETFTGTNPIDFALRDYDGDGFRDVAVVNNGSNDVSVLLNNGSENGNWNGFRLGPRLEVGENPNAISNQSASDSGQFLGLTVTTTNGGRDPTTGDVVGTVELLPDLGQGFFDDLNPTVTNLPGTPGTPGFGGGSAFVPVGGAVVQVDPVSGTVTPIPQLPASLGASSVITTSITPGSLDLLVLTSTGIQLVVDALGNLGLEGLFGIASPSSASLTALQEADLLQLYVTQEGSEIITVFDVEAGQSAESSPTLLSLGISLPAGSFSVAGLTGVISLLGFGPLGLFFGELGTEDEGPRGRSSGVRRGLWDLLQQAFSQLVHVGGVVAEEVVTVVGAAAGGLNLTLPTSVSEELLSPTRVTNVLWVTPLGSVIGSLAKLHVEVFGPSTGSLELPVGVPAEEWLWFGFWEKSSPRGETPEKGSSGAAEEHGEEPESKDQEGEQTKADTASNAQPSNLPEASHRPVSGVPGPVSAERSSRRVERIWWQSLSIQPPARATHHIIDSP